jgi:hypothetical protein
MDPLPVATQIVKEWIPVGTINKLYAPNSSIKIGDSHPHNVLHQGELECWVKLDFVTFQHILKPTRLCNTTLKLSLWAEE